MARTGAVRLVPALLLGGLSACSGAAAPEPMDPAEISPEVTEQTPDRFYADTPASPSTTSRFPSPITALPAIAGPAT